MKYWPTILLPLKLWIYRINIPGNIPEFPLPWYTYWGITTEDEPMDRIIKHLGEPKNNREFNRIRQLVPFEQWDIYIEQLPTITNNNVIEIFKLATEEIYRIQRDNTYYGPHGLNASVGGEHVVITNYLGWPKFDRSGCNSGIKHITWDNRKQFHSWRLYIPDIIDKHCKDLKLLLDLTQYAYRIPVEITDHTKYRRMLEINSHYSNINT